jgi:FkbM family methyltransferase
MNHVQELTVNSSTPVLFRLVKLLRRGNVRGSYRLLQAFLPRWAGCVPVYLLPSNVRLAVPIGRKENCWDLRDILEYEGELIAAFCSALFPLSNVTLFDCGADIGLFSALVCSRCDRIRRVLAFEPNPNVQDVFRRNISSLPNGEPHATALGSFTGFGRLERPSYDDSDHARYLLPADKGVTVVPLDSFRIFGEDIAIKIDVEGGELDVIRGAAETIRRASHCVLTLEAHPRVCERAHVSPNDCMAFLASIRPFRFMVAETGRLVTASEDIIDPNIPLNVLATTIDK